MSGFASEISVFLGITTSDIYSSPFLTVTFFLVAVGVILTPIYLLVMLQQVFYNAGAAYDLATACDITDTELKNQGDREAGCFGTSCVLPSNAVFSDASPHEVFVAVCFLVPIIGIGLYPQLATHVYDVKTVAVNAQIRQSYMQVAQENPKIYANSFLSPRIPKAEVATIMGITK